MEILSINVKGAKSFPPWNDGSLKETEIDSGTAFAEGLLQLAFFGINDVKLLKING